MMRKRVTMTTVAVFSALAMLQPAGVLAAKVIPADLPRPGATPPATDKPVKVYILSGQSNMVGFGTLDKASPVYPSIFLSADPSIMPAVMPVGSSALLPHGIWQAAEADAPKGAKALIFEGAYDPSIDYAARQPVRETTVALGTVAENLPSIDGQHTVLVKAWIDVPMTGMHDLHVGYEASTHAVLTLDGKQVYRKTVGGEPEITKVKLDAGKRYPITITYLQGGSAAFWMEHVDIRGKGDLKWVIEERGLFGCMVDENGDWTQRTDVILNDAYLGKGKSTPLNPTANGKFFGPELGFGYVMGEFHDEPVLVIKTTIGNRSLAWDCLPPGSERYVVDGKVYAGYGDFSSSWAEGTEPPTSGGWYAGKQYDDYTAAVHSVLDNFDTIYPQYKDQGYEVAGFVWWQGHKDQNPVHAAHYEKNLVNLIKAWRKEFKAPEAKWAIATIAFGGWGLEEPGLTVANAQLAVSGETGKYPAFKGNVKTIEARAFWRERAVSPTGTGYHYNHNAETYMLTGDALGRAMVEMLGGKAEPLAVSNPASATDLPKAVQLIYSDPFLNPWSKEKSADKPTDEQMAAMGPALRPIILGRLLPDFAAEAPRVPAYRRGGMSLVPIVTGEQPNADQARGSGLTSQLDQIISYYKAAGIHDYDWRRFGPAMQTAVWDYFSFDPPETLDKGKSGRYRDITLPAGMENWMAVDFDAAAAGWVTGPAPFGQNDGRQEALRENCRIAQCGCSTPPGTLWEKEVLLMRQTFAIPTLKPDHRYRLIVGGSAHAFSGEGFALYVNGKLFAEAKDGHLKKGGIRGGYVYNDLLPEFQSGKVTIAIKSFLRTTYHKDKPAPPRGHLSVWLEEMKIPEVVLKTVQ